MNTTPDRYHRLSISLHWLTLLLLIAIYALIELRGIYPRGSEPRELMKTWHGMLGLLVLASLLVRIPLRLRFRAPPIIPPPPSWQHGLTAVMHVALYVFLIAMPILGWMILSAEGKPIPFFGLHLPALIAANDDLAHRIEDIHGQIGNIGYFLIGLHALAALFHHYLVRDNTLLRILPGRAGKSLGR
ncbi:MAG: cytochrome b [Xanthomonadales bacterium]|nr:cytochrome b [Xanthomonadales bacterium]